MEGLFHRDIFVHILRTPEGVEEQESQTDNDHPVALEVTDAAQTIDNGVLEQGEDATATHQGHEDARGFFSVFAQAFHSEVEDATPHHGGA